ncbi:MAG TPA: alpha/beta hydrolase [Vicinamibacterales bacterium]|jgi:proline iminopeptidase
MVAAQGADLFYSTRGIGPACLVLTSIGTKPYERLTPSQLSDRFTLVYVDLRGAGRSTGEPADLTFDVLAADLEAVRADLGVERVAVLGHSILGALAIEYGRRCPSTVSHVIAVGTPPRGDMAWLSSHAASFFERDASDDRKRLYRANLAALPPDATMGQVMAAQTPMRFFDPSVDAATLFEGAEVKRPFFAHLLGPLTATWDVTVDPGSLQVPVFIAHGRYDYTVPHALWDEVVPTLPHAVLQVFERSGHQPFFEEPDRFVEGLTSWMASQGSLTR